MEPISRRSFIAISLTASLSACTQLPRGAPLQREVVNAKDEDFSVYQVTRSFLPVIAAWPETGGPPTGEWLPRIAGSATQIIQAGDQLQVSVWDPSENSLLTAPGQIVTQLGPITVSPGGTIFLPYVGRAQVAGKTPESARETVQRVIEGVSPSAQVQLSVVPGSRSAVDLVGGVTAPGRYPLINNETTVLSAISQGGGVPSALRNPYVRLVRDNRSYITSLEKLFASPDLDTVLQGGDKIIVEPEERVFLAFGATGTEQRVVFPTPRLSALEALTIAGGISDSRADPRGVLVLRDYPQSAVRDGQLGPARSRVIFTIDLTTADGLFSAKEFQIQGGDVIFATESPVTSAQTILGLVGATLGTAARVQNM